MNISVVRVRQGNIGLLKVNPFTRIVTNNDTNLWNTIDDGLISRLVSTSLFQDPA